MCGRETWIIILILVHAKYELYTSIQAVETLLYKVCEIIRPLLGATLLLRILVLDPFLVLPVPLVLLLFGYIFDPTRSGWRGLDPASSGIEFDVLITRCLSWVLGDTMDFCPRGITVCGFRIGLRRSVDTAAREGVG